MTRIALFPLGTVLFPGSRLRLQLFEPRYLRMLDDLAAAPADERAFGVVLIRRGHEVGTGKAVELHRVGCLAQITASAPERGPHGLVVHLVATGTRRFRLRDVADASTPYQMAEIEWLDQAARDESAVADLVAQVDSLLAAYEAALGGGGEPVSASRSQHAYRVAERVHLSLGDQQRVLEGANAADRLLIVAELLRRERAILGRFAAVPLPPGPGRRSLNAN